MTDSKTYIPWVDGAKIIGIYLVTLGHGHLVPDHVRVLIYSFHMPLFFVLSGFLYKKRTFGDTLKRTTKTILVPYFLISAVCLCYYLALKGIQTGLEWPDVWRRVGAVCMGLGYESGGWIPVSSPMWYVIALWFVYLIMSVSSNKYWDVIILLVSLAGFICLRQLRIDTLPPVDSALMAVPFFLFGYKCKDLFKIDSPKWLLIASVLLIPVWYFIASYNGRVDMCGCRFGKSIILFYLAGLLGGLILISVSKAIRWGGGRNTHPELSLSWDSTLSPSILQRLYGTNSSRHCRLMRAGVF